MPMRWLFALVVDIVASLLHMTTTNGECAVTALPLEEFVGRDFVRDQMSRYTLHLADDLAETDTRWQANKHVRVIVCATERDQIDADLGTLGTDCSIHTLFNLTDEQG